MPNEAFIEVNRKSGGKARIRADAITAFVEVEIKEDDRNKPTIQIHIGANSFVVVKDEPLWALWNKTCVALGGRDIMCVSEPSVEHPTHPLFGKTLAPQPEPEKLTLDALEAAE